MSQHDLFVGGAWVKGAVYQPNLNPSNLDESVGDYAQADEAITGRAIAAASSLSACLPSSRNSRSSERNPSA